MDGIWYKFAKLILLHIVRIITTHSEVVLCYSDTVVWIGRRAHTKRENLKISTSINGPCAVSYSIVRMSTSSKGFASSDESSSLSSNILRVVSSPVLML